MECSSDPNVFEEGDMPRCPENTWLVPILLGGYILITNVLMLNLLIAMFRYFRRNAHSFQCETVSVQS